MPMTPGQMSRLLPKASVEGTRKVLNRLTRQGIVRSTHVGDAAVTYELNRSHVAADAIIELANQVQAVHRRIQDLLASWDPTPVYAALFGSWARAEATADSDVDLLVWFPADADIVTLLSLEDKLSRLLTVPVHIVSAGSASSSVRRILADSIPL